MGTSDTYNLLLNSSLLFSALIQFRENNDGDLDPVISILNKRGVAPGVSTFLRASCTSSSSRFS